MKRCGHKPTTGVLFKSGSTRLRFVVCDTCKIVRIEIKQEIELPVDTLVKDWNNTMRRLVK